MAKANGTLRLLHATLLRCYRGFATSALPASCAKVLPRRARCRLPRAARCCRGWRGFQGWASRRRIGWTSCLDVSATRHRWRGDRGGEESSMADARRRIARVADGAHQQHLARLADIDKASDKSVVSYLCGRIFIVLLLHERCIDPCFHLLLRLPAPRIFCLRFRRLAGRRAARVCHLAGRTRWSICVCDLRVRFAAMHAARTSAALPRFIYLYHARYGRLCLRFTARLRAAQRCCLLQRGSCRHCILLCVYAATPRTCLLPQPHVENM